MKTETNEWYFDVAISKPNDDYDEPSCIALSKDGFGLDDSLGSHNLSKNIIDALNRAGVYGDSELMESIWEINDETMTEQEVINNMQKEGFVYCKGLFQI